jgi:cytidyltransferase-like protein
VKFAICSGYFNPIHIGHLDYLQHAKSLGDKLFVIVNNDHQVEIKGSTPFMNEKDRYRIVSALECVDGVTLSTDRDNSVLKTLKHLVIHNQGCGRNSFIFCNGGDRGSENTPEEQFCSYNSYLLTSTYNVGGDKAESSSVLINKATVMHRSINDELKKIDKTLKGFDL